MEENRCRWKLYSYFTASNGTCNIINHSERVDCGWGGINENTCLAQNGGNECCWSLVYDGSPQCFYKRMQANILFYPASKRSKNV